MKLFIDIENKVIKIEETVNFGELIEKVKKQLPGEGKDYKIETNSVIQWSNPVVIQDWPLYRSYPYWWATACHSISGTVTPGQTITSAGSQGSFTVDMSQQNQYCIEC